MSSEITFEELRSEDLERCVDALLSIPSEYPSPLKNKDAIRRMVYGDRIMTVVAKHKGRILAVVSANWVASWPPEFSFLAILEKEPPVMDIGGLMIDKLLELMKKRFPTVPFVTVRLPNDFTDAVALYSAKGFVVEGFLREGLLGRDVVFMKKKV